MVQFASTSESRKDSYWRNVMKDQPMPKAIQGLIVHDHSESAPKNSNEKADCHGTHDQNSFTDDFEPTPNVSAYPDDIDAKQAGTIFTKNFDDKKFTKDFEPGPQATIYSEWRIQK
ncbi:hypothetical protein L484_026922 [Morus notabilis]|uniref:Organ-specific protein S2 n=1 Tax=Morus notabilis TaxID=981085 RepID=W9R967_9ROSA|nr:hypothetical protein L484_026922 [Morus notabilis]